MRLCSTRTGGYCLGQFRQRHPMEHELPALPHHANQVWRRSLVSRDLEADAHGGADIEPELPGSHAYWSMETLSRFYPYSTMRRQFDAYL